MAHRNRHGVEMRHKPGTKQSQGEKSVKDIRHATFEWPEFSPPRWDNDDASAAEFALRARAAQISDDRFGLEGDI